MRMPEKCLAKLPLPAGMRDKLGLPPSGAAVMEEESDDEEGDDESESEDEEKAQPAATPAPAPVAAPEETKKKGGMFRKGNSKVPPAAEKLPPPSPEKTPTRKDLKQIA